VNALVDVAVFVVAVAGLVALVFYVRATHK